jgi:uncharacterized membrane protein
MTVKDKTWLHLAFLCLYPTYAIKMNKDAVHCTSFHRLYVHSFLINHYFAMDAAHLHLLSNHLPIVGYALALVLLFLAFARKSSEIYLTAYLLFLISGLGGIVAFLTGEAAEEVAEQKFGESMERVIHEHEEAGELAYFFIIALTVLALLGLYATLKKKNFAIWVHRSALVLGLLATLAAVHAGYHGGLINHGKGVMPSTMEAIPQEGEEH